MKKLLLVMFVILFASCSKEENQEEIIPQTFLEKYDNTEWKSENLFSITQILRIKNDKKNPFESWALPQFGQDCYFYINIGNEYEINIIKNLSDTLIISMAETKAPGFVDETKTTIIKEGESVNLLIEYFYKGVKKDENKNFLVKSNSKTDIKSLNICD